ncbi:MAG: hypothetical protein KUG77_20690 [Nannocystaceae bacterium]|nr:hypothetical protein [Nannocystaceae bacterium]
MHYTASVLGQLTAAILCAALTVPAPALGGAPEPAARQAAELTHARRYAEAAEAYGRAFEETGDPVHLYSQAMSLRRAGSCVEAIGVFEAFIAERPPESDVEAARMQVAQCVALVDRAAPKPTPPAEPNPSASPPLTSSAGEAHPPVRFSWARDPWGGVLIAVGGVTALTGGGLLLVSSGSTNAPAAETERGHARRETDVLNTSTAGLVLLGVGATLLVGGILRYSVVARRDGRKRGSDGGLTWRF